MATEKTQWQWLSNARRELGAALHMERIENMVGAGHPDVELCYAGVQAWIEQKVAKRPARKTTVLRFGSPLRDSQKEWAEKRIAAGGRVWYLIQVGSGHERQMYLIRGTLETVNQLYTHVTEDWCRAHDALDVTTPARVVLVATQGD